MRYLFCVIITIIFVGQITAQNKVLISDKLLLNFSTGLQYNFFADLNLPLRKYKNYILPRRLPNNEGLIFDQKNPVGTFVTLEIQYYFSQKKSAGIGFVQTSNWGKHWLEIQNGNIISIIRDIRIRNINRFYYLYYEYQAIPKYPEISFGIYLLSPQYQSIVLKLNYFEVINKTGFNKYNMASWGLWIGAKYNIIKTQKVNFGIFGKFFYTIPFQRSENLVISPFLQYQL